MKERILIKHDIAENWDKAINFIPMAGELILYDGIIENGEYVEYPRLKVGDGEHRLAELPFFDGRQEEKVSYECENGILKLI